MMRGHTVSLFRVFLLLEFRSAEYLRHFPDCFSVHDDTDMGAHH